MKNFNIIMQNPDDLYKVCFRRHKHKKNVKTKFNKTAFVKKNDDNFRWCDLLEYSKQQN